MTISVCYDVATVYGGNNIKCNKQDDANCCQRECQKNKKCEFWTFDRKTELCYLKSRKENVQNDKKEFISGGVDCIVPNRLAASCKSCDSDESIEFSECDFCESKDSNDSSIDSSECCKSCESNESGESIESSECNDFCESIGSGESSNYSSKKFNKLNKSNIFKYGKTSKQRLLAEEKYS